MDGVAKLWDLVTFLGAESHRIEEMAADSYGGVLGIGLERRDDGTFYIGFIHSDGSPEMCTLQLGDQLLALSDDRFDRVKPSRPRLA